MSLKKILFFPFAVIYGIITSLRNLLYDWKFLKSKSVDVHTICVGNLAVGGTGKTPHVEYLINILQNDFKIAILSRGYKRKTSGFIQATSTSTAFDIGDEPLQYKTKNPQLEVCVDANRVNGIKKMLELPEPPKVVILDDAFQHRSVKAGLNIVLTEYKNLYTRDFLLPVGDLRDTKSSIKRADIIVVTKCKPDLSPAEKEAIVNEIKPLRHQSVYFTEIIYGTPYHLFTQVEKNFTADTNVLLVCGIANPKPLKDFLGTNVNSYDMLRYPDHHIFDIDDLAEIKKQLKKIQSHNKIIITTEKDAVRLFKFEEELKDFAIYVLPVQHSFLFGDGIAFDLRLKGFINSYIRPFS